MSCTYFKNYPSKSSQRMGKSTKYPFKYIKQIGDLKCKQKRENNQPVNIDLKVQNNLIQKTAKTEDKIKLFAVDIDEHSTASSEEQVIKIKKLIRYKTQEDYNELTQEKHASLNTKNTQKLINFLLLFKNLICSQKLSKIITKLCNHFSNLSSSDKYIRMIYSLLKLYRSIYEHNNVGDLSKELLLARRVIRWHSKYDTIRQILNKKYSIQQKLFKLFQLTGDLFDFSAFWLKLFQEQYPQYKSITQTLTNLESDFYFYQCSIWLTRYTYRFITNIIQLYNCQTMKQNHYFEEDHSKKISKEMNKIKGQLKLNGLRVLKYIFDCRTSYQNYSKKVIQLSPVTSSVYGILSSTIGIFLLWN